MDYIKIAKELNFPDDAVSAIDSIPAECKNIAAETAKRYCMNILSMKDVLNILDITNTNISKYQKYLLFLLSCCLHLKSEYKAFGISDNIYHNTAMDIKYKLLECKTVYNIWGISCPLWFERHFKLKLFALGRLQYEPISFEFEDFTKCGYTVSHQSTVYNCHIPSSGSLNGDEVIASFKSAYNFFAEKLKDGIMPIMCYSWLLFPDNKKFLPKNCNTIKFSDIFTPIKAVYTKGFNDAWRVFGCNYNGDTSCLPIKTSMQQSVCRWLAKGNNIGMGVGILLFDGEKILD